MLSRAQTMALVVVAAALGVLLGSPLPANAFRVYPIMLELPLDASGTSARGVIRVENEADEPVPVRILAERRAISADGAEIDQPLDLDPLNKTPRSAADALVVFPTQMLLKPKLSQQVRLQWQWHSPPTQELSFRVIVEQLSINFSKEVRRSSVAFAFRYVVHVHVVPPGAQPNLIAASTELTTSDDGQKHLSVVLENRGTKSVRVTVPKLAVTDGTTTIHLDGDALSALTGLRLLAGARHRLVVPWPAALSPQGQLHSELTFVPGVR